MLPAVRKAAAMRRVERLRALEAAATPGPWEVMGLYVTVPERDVAGDPYVDMPGDQNRPQWDADAALIAEARNALPALLALAEASAEYDRVLRKPQPTHAEAYDAITNWRAALAALDADT